MNLSFRIVRLSAPLLVLVLLPGAETGCGFQPGSADLLPAPLKENSGGLPDPPVAAQKPFEVSAPHGAVRVDEYYWLRDDSRKHPEILAYLKAENVYVDAIMALLTPLQEKVYRELVGRLKQDDSTVPYRYKDYWYYTRFEEGKEYPIYARRKGNLDSPEEILLDVNQLAEGHTFFSVGNWKVSPNQQLLAYVIDIVGRRQHQLEVKNLVTGEMRSTGVGGMSASLAWAADNQTIFYIENDPTTLLSKRVKSHVLGSSPAGDRLIYQEADDSFYMSVGLTRSESYLCINLRSTVSSEQRCAPTEDPRQFRLVAARERDFEYDADHLGNRWVIRTNWQAQNFRLMQVPEGTWDDRSRWTNLIPHDESVFIHSFELFDDFLAVGERSQGLTRIRILSRDGESEYVAADESAYTMRPAFNAEPATDSLRYVYSSLTTPPTTFELNVKTGERRLLKEEPVLGGFDKAGYVTERLWATARDGARIPVSVVHSKDFRRDGRAAMLQYGYGSYGNSTEPAFNRNIISLLDRGMVYAIAHIRGGQEMGRQWYEDGRLRNKMNTFTDFVDVTDFLVGEGFAAPDRVAALGGSAGGLLMGAVANLAPEKYRVILSLVPFVDVVTTMLDESIPLTTNEFDEWGNPKNPGDYDYILSYSPYDNLGPQEYPAMYVDTGLWDSQVQYWEAAKYVARLRDRKVGDRLVLFRTQMEAGHGGRSGRFQRYQEWAERYAFMLNQLGIRE